MAVRCTLVVEGDTGEEVHRLTCGLYREDFAKVDIPPEVAAKLFTWLLAVKGQIVDPKPSG